MTGGILDLWALLRSRRSGRTLTEAAMAACFSLATVLLVLTAAANLGLRDREARTAWRWSTAAADGTGTATLLTVMDHAGGTAITRTSYAPLAAEAPVPPGLDRQIRPGELYVSPALAERAERQPEIYSRYRTATGLIGRSGLARPDELAAVEGVAADDPRFTQPGGYQAFSANGPVSIDRFAATVPAYRGEALYRALTALGSVMIVLPALSLVAAAARVVATRRARELAVVRLIGARSSQLGILSALDAAVPAAVGAAAGVALALPATAGLARVPVQGGRWYAADLVPPVFVLAALALAVVGVAIGSTVTAVWRVSRDPMGVALSRRPAAARLWRVGAFVAAVAAFVAMVRSGDLSPAGAVAAWTAVVAGTALMGPVVITLLGQLRLAGARRGVGLLAARRLLDDPVGAYRQIGPLALAAFVAGLLAAVQAVETGPSGIDGADVLYVDFPAGTSAAHVSEALALVADHADGDVVHTIVGPGGAPDAAGPVHLELQVDRPENVETVRSRLTAFDPGLLPVTGQELFATDQTLVDDFSRASVLLLVVVSVASAAGATALGVGTIIDQQRPLTALRTIGIPLAELRSARRRAVLAPLAVSAVGAGSVGMVLTFVFVREAVDLRPFGLVLVFVAGAVGLALVTEIALGPLLARSTSDRRVLEV